MFVSITHMCIKCLWIIFIIKTAW